MLHDHGRTVRRRTRRGNVGEELRNGFAEMGRERGEIAFIQPAAPDEVAFARIDHQNQQLHDLVAPELGSSHLHVVRWRAVKAGQVLNRARHVLLDVRRAQ